VQAKPRGFCGAVFRQLCQGVLRIRVHAFGLAAQKFARGVGAIDFEPLGIGVIGVGKPQIVKQRGDIEQFGIEFEILPDTLHCTEHKDADGVVEQHLRFMLPHQLGGLARDSAVGDRDAGENGGHYRTPVLVPAICAACIDRSSREHCRKRSDRSVSE